MKLVSQEDLGFQEAKVPGTFNASSLWLLSVRRCLKSEWS